MSATLIVMRLANMRRIHPAQDNSRVCGVCGEQVGIYPSGQRILARRPDARIVCEVCCANQPGYDLAMLAPGAIEERGESEER